jgi:antitoxin MazE
LADEIGLEVGSEVDLRVEHGRLKIYPPGAPRYTLEEVVAQITPENRHEEWDTGPPVGKEV